MRILAVDDEAAALQRISGIVAELQPEAEMMCFDSSLAALDAARKKEVDIAFLKPEMPELSGLDLGQYLKELYPQINLIFLTEGPEYSFDAMRLHASGYIMKPAVTENVNMELEDLRHPIGVKRHKRVFVQTFGNFEFFVDGRPVVFRYSRTKEMVAVLVNNRGAQTTNGEIIATLWEDDGEPEKKGSYLGNLRQDLQNTMTRRQLSGIFIKQRGSIAIAVDRIECDLYDWLEKKQESKYHYLGDYMNQYSWSEFMHAELDEISYAMMDDE